MVNVDDDTATIAAVLDGDVQAFATIIHRYEPALLRLTISRLRNRQVAEELVQDAFLSAYKSLHTYNPQYQFRTWLWTIQLNKLHQHRLTVSRCSASCQPVPANSRNLSAARMKTMLRQPIEPCLRNGMQNCTGY